MHADLSKIATLNTMLRLGEVFDDEPEGDDLREGAANNVTPANALADREGFNANFLPGWNLPLPMPTGDLGDDLTRRLDGNGVELGYHHFSVLMSKSRRLPLLTAVNVDGSKAKSRPRVKTWKYDGRIAIDDQTGEEVYGGNALDRGHMVRREDPVWGTDAEAQKANVDTFHYTNSCPQMGVMNQKTWLSLENYILQHAKADRMRVNVYTGPYFSSDDLQYRGALIPRAFWKIVAFILPDGRPSATAYQVSQEKELEELEFVFAGFKTFQISVRQVIDKTGIDFTNLLPFDGFSQHEAANGQPLVEQLESLSQIRV